MELLTQFIDLVLHLDTHLAALIAQYGTWIYLVLFLIIFCETGLVITPFLPGDSLLFVAGTMAAVGAVVSMTKLPPATTWFPALPAVSVPVTAMVTVPSAPLAGTT